jgi:tetratricopeptide (TPR) repeat protein
MRVIPTADPRSFLCHGLCVSHAARRRAAAVFIAALCILSNATTLDAQGRKPPSGGRGQAELPSEDRLPRKLEQRLQEFVAQGKPDEAAALLADKPRMYRVFIARAHAQAAAQTQDPEAREHHLAKAVEEYRDILALQADAKWFRGEKRRFEVAQWHVEMGDLILRRWIAPDMDRYEITSGLDFDRARVTRRLQEAQTAYAAAGELLDDLMIGMRTEEERYLLMGLAGKIVPLQEQQQLNGAWASLYLGLTAAPETEGRKGLFTTALNAFDAVGRVAKEPDRKYNALLGAGIALSHIKHYAEADAAFDRIIRSTAPLPLTARARFERARSLIEAHRFDEARDELDALAAITEPEPGSEYAGALFYIRLAPLIRAYTYCRELETNRGGSAKERKAVQDQAYAAFAKITEQGGIWPEIVQVYLDTFGKQKRELTDLTDVELRAKVERLMAGKEYGEAIPILKIILDRASMKEYHAEAGFNLGVCYFQAQDLRGAAEAFLGVARSKPAADVGEKATEHAYRCWRQLAHASDKPEDYLQLAAAGELLAGQFPQHRLATEAAWVAALARQEGGDYTAALTAYGRVPQTSGNYWAARRNIARCRQAIYDGMSSTASAPRRRRAAEEAANAWAAVADELAAALKAQSDKPAPASKESRPKKGASSRPAKTMNSHLSPVGIPGFSSLAEVEEWITDARLAAAALFAGDEIRGFNDGLRVLADLPLTGRVLALRIRCYRGLGDLKAANLVLEGFIRQSGDAAGSAEPSSQPGENQTGEAVAGEPTSVLAALVGLAAEMEKEVTRLKKIGRDVEATHMAADAVETIRQLLDWIQKQPEYKKHVPTVRYSLVKALAQAGCPQEAMTQLEELMRESPSEGEYIRTAARLQEDIARGAGEATSAPAGAGRASRDAALDKAEALWAKLLEDQTLRDRAPDAYWEARYHWLEHQLRHGHAAEVVKGIEAEQAWYPDLGGAPWQTKLLDLAKQAQATDAGGGKRQ